MISIEITNPTFALHMLNGLTANNQVEFDFKNNLARKIEHAVFREKLSREWRTIPEFPDYEISGGGMIRMRKTREHIPIACEYDEPVSCVLVNASGHTQRMWLEIVLFAAFPELEKIS